MASSLIDAKTNKINIYLVKEIFKDEDSITKILEDKEIKRVELDDIGIFYYKQSCTNPPEWISSFFNNHPSINKKHFFGSGTKALLIVKIPHRNKNRFFAIPFGSGRFLMKDYSFEERFGLVTSLNKLEEKSIRGIDKRTISANAKSSREQIAKASETAAFQIDFEKELIESITGKSNDINFGNTITGKDALSVSTKVDVKSIKDYLKKSLSTYEKKDYQKSFKWIDQIKEVKLQSTIEKLDEKLVKKINNKDALVWLAVPEIIDWSKVLGFKYSNRKRDNFYDEMELSGLLNDPDSPVFKIEDLKTKFISCWHSKEDYEYSWSQGKRI